MARRYKHTRRALRRRRVTRKERRKVYKTRKQRGGELPNDMNTIVDYRDGNDIDSVSTPVSREMFETVSTASPESAQV